MMGISCLVEGLIEKKAVDGRTDRKLETSRGFGKRGGGIREQGCYSSSVCGRKTKGRLP